jgi:CO/xanthine dehydrogenase Mo-binding subunit
MDEMAEEARVDAVKFRLRNLTDDRAKAVIKAAAEKFGWPSAEKPGFGSGIAFAQYKNVKSYAAVAIEVEVTEDAEIKLHRAVIAADAGHCIDPNGLAMQLEGGLIQAASWTLYEEVTYDAGGVTSRDWDGYPILRFGNVPKIETVIMERSGDPFLGAGEATSGPTIAAISNAVYNATGLRLRRLPLTSDALKTAALE